MEKDYDNMTRNNSAEESERALANWAVLRKNIQEMRHKANYLVVMLAEREEKRLESKYQEKEVNNPNYGTNLLMSEDEQKPKGILANVIINPVTSSWLGAWQLFMTFILFIGYFNDPNHMAFILSAKHSTDENMRDRTADLTINLVFDVLITIDIILRFITAYEKDDGSIEYRWSFIIWAYFKGTMCFDLVATIPSLFLDGNTDWFFLKLFRMVHMRRVYAKISDIIKYALNRFGFDKASVEKTSYIFDLIIFSFSIIHILGCIWIYVGNVIKCSWMEKYECSGGDSGMPVNRKSDSDVYITSVYWVITTLTTVGYGDYKGYTS